MSTDLVPIFPDTGASRPALVYVPPPAEFLTQLIAAKTRVPQARDRRRGEPDEAIAAYSSSMQKTRRNPAGRALSRAL